MPTVLLTFTGFHDPFAKGLVGEEEQPGPVVTLAREIHFDRIILFSTPGTAKHSVATREAVGQISPDTEVEIEDFPLLDPTDYEAIRDSLLTWITKNRSPQSADEYYVSIASGHLKCTLLGSRWSLAANYTQESSILVLPDT